MRRGIDLADPKLEQLRFADKQYWFAPPLKAPEPTWFDPPIVHLLPNYDEHVASYSDYTPSFDRARVRVPANAEGALMNHIIVSNGQVVGGWRRTLGERSRARRGQAIGAADQRRKRCAVARGRTIW